MYKSESALANLNVHTEWTSQYSITYLWFNISVKQTLSP